VKINTTNFLDFRLLVASRGCDLDTFYFTDSSNEVSVIYAFVDDDFIQGTFSSGNRPLVSDVTAAHPFAREVSATIAVT